MSIKRPKLFSYLDYRDLLKDFFEFLKETQQFTVRQFATQVGFGSPSYLKMILDKKRSLRPRNARTVARRLGFNAHEMNFFETLVRFNSAKDANTRDLEYQNLLKFRQFLQIRRTADAEYECFSSWYVIPILEGIETDWAKNSPAKMAESLNIKEEQVRDALSLLQRLGLIEKKDGAWRRLDKILETAPTVQSLTVRNFHKVMIEKALEAVDAVPENERALGGLTLPLTDESYIELRDLLFKFRQDLSARYSSEPEATKVFQLNLQLFPLFKLKD